MKRFFNFLFLSLALSLALPSFAQAQGNNNLLLQTDQFHPEFQAWLNKGSALGYTLPSTGQRILLNDYCGCLKTAGAFTEFDFHYIPANDGSSEMGTINFVDPDNYQLTLVNSPPWVSNVGWDWNSTGYANTHFSPLNDGVNFTQNDASFGGYFASGDGLSGGAYNAGCSDNADGITNGIILLINNNTSSGRISGRINDNTTEIGSSGGVVTGFKFLKRLGTSGNRKFSFYNGAVTTSWTTVSTTPPASEFFINTSNGNGTPKTSARNTTSMFFACSALDGLESAFYDCWTTYKTAIGL